jgi:hypothetical protein
MIRDDRKAHVQRLMASISGEGTPMTITESGEVIEGEVLPSFEDVAYELDLYSWVLDGPAYVIVQAVRRLPEEVRQFVYSECLFVQGWMRVIRFRVSRPYLIIVPETFDHETGDDSRIAHQIALAWMQQAGLIEECTLAEEIHVAELVRAWGFTGAGANVEQYRRDAEQYGPGAYVL